MNYMALGQTPNTERQLILRGNTMGILYRINITRDKYAKVRASTGKDAFDIAMRGLGANPNDWKVAQSITDEQHRVTLTFKSEYGDEIKVTELERDKEYTVAGEGISAGTLQGAMNKATRKGLRECTIFDEYNRMAAMKINGQWVKL